MYTAVIIDDEVLAIEELRFLVSNNREISVLRSFTNPLKTYAYLEKTHVDIVFLDIQMPMQSGIDLARDLIALQHPPKIIFVTAYDSYAIEAFNVNAVDYLLKPTSQKRLNQSIEKIIKSDLEDVRHRVDSMINYHQKKSFITLYHDGIFIPIQYVDIVFCDSVDGNVVIHTCKHEIPYHGTLQALEEILTSICFFRSHRSCIMNIAHIEKIEPTERTFLVKMKGYAQLLPVSRNQVNSFKERMSIQ